MSGRASLVAPLGGLERLKCRVAAGRVWDPLLDAIAAADGGAAPRRAIHRCLSCDARLWDPRHHFRTTRTAQTANVALRSLRNGARALAVMGTFGYDAAHVHPLRGLGLIATSLAWHIGHGRVFLSRQFTPAEFYSGSGTREFAREMQG